MSSVSISPTTGAAQVLGFRATSADRESVGITPGAALDALTAQIDPAASARLIVYIEPVTRDAPSPDQRRRLDELKQLYRLASTAHGQMSGEERGELERLFDAQFAASERRAEAMAPERAK